MQNDIKVAQLLCASIILVILRWVIVSLSVFQPSECQCEKYLLGRASRSKEALPWGRLILYVHTSWQYLVESALCQFNSCCVEMRAGAMQMDEGSYCWAKAEVQTCTEKPLCEEKMCFFVIVRWSMRVVFLVTLEVWIYKDGNVRLPVESVCYASMSSVVQTGIY